MDWAGCNCILRSRYLHIHINRRIKDLESKRKLEGLRGRSWREEREEKNDVIFLFKKKQNLL